jgi:hypothetical protein
VCVCVCVCVCTCIYTYIHVYIYIYIHTHTYTYTYVLIYILVVKHVCALVKYVCALPTDHVSRSFSSQISKRIRTLTYKYMLAFKRTATHHEYRQCCVHRTHTCMKAFFFYTDIFVLCCSLRNAHRRACPGRHCMDIRCVWVFVVIAAPCPCVVSFC